MLGVYSSVVVPHSATYCSAPITSGKPYFDWLTRSGKSFANVDETAGDDRDAHAAFVIQANRQHSEQVVARLRTVRAHVIDPGAVPSISKWSQNDWLGFWEDVIDQFVAEVVFVDGWEYSYGCVHEFWFAQIRHVPTFDERLQPITLSQAETMIRSACEIIRQRGGSVARMEAVLKALRDLDSNTSSISDAALGNRSPRGMR